MSGAGLNLTVAALSWLARRRTGSLRATMALQIALAITLACVPVMASGCWLAQDLEAISAQSAPARLPAERQLAQHSAPDLERRYIDLLQQRRTAFTDRAWRVMLFTVAAGALVAGVFAGWFARRLWGSARRMAATADRIGANALRERLLPQEHPRGLTPVALAFNRMLDRLEDAFGRLSAFSSDLAHDLRAPVHRLMGAAQVALSRPRSGEEYRDLLAATVEDCERMAKLIDNILFLARADHAQAGAAPVWFPLEGRVRAIAEFFDLLAEEQGLHLHWSVDAAAGLQAWADETLLSRAVGNLLTNAMRHARPSSTVRLLARGTADGGCVIEVRNEGEPIAPVHQARIFQRRYQAEPGRAREPGAGLGLAIVKSVMDLHGGSAQVQSAPSQPTVFVLRFPGTRRRPVDLRPAVRGYLPQ